MVSLPFMKKKEPEKKAFQKMSTEEKLKELGLGSEEFAEDFAYKRVKTGYPAPIKRLRFHLLDPNHNIESTYHHFMIDFGERLGLDKNYKVVDSMGLSVGSSMFGNLQSRMAAQQNQASQYLKGIADMVKGMFQIVREVRILDERLQFYKDSESENSELSLSSEIVLKGLWVDQVEGGSKNPSSVYGLAATVGFTILPDLFFRTKPMKKKEIEKIVKSMKFNEKVKEILMRKLRQYYEWKERTKGELEVRKNFEIKYLRQHYATIKLYLSWISPYLRNIRKMKHSEHLSEEVDVVKAFESTIIELETIHWRTGYGKAPFDYNAVILLNFHYLVKPELAFHHYEYQHKGPVHVGKLIMSIRAYAWTKKQIDSYIKYRNEEELDLLKEINSSIEQAMNSLGDDLKKYLKSAGEEFPDSEDKKNAKPAKKMPGILEPFLGIFGGFGEIAKSVKGAPVPGKKDEPKKKEPSAQYKNERDQTRASVYARMCAWDGYQRFKEHHELLHW
ncbi:MAG: hypothetical protein V1859_02920 [archaeon]